MSSPERSDSPKRPIRRWRVRVTAEGYATTFGATKKEAVANARAATYLATPRPEWYAYVSDMKEIHDAKR